ncbi:polysaccharide pyruvyl transferase family protein [Paenibacillus thiaminolyticus]|uniref:polysaccharide pyruvyl transferase family protein n=1 Tax=Paenibacillus thiaminolyticus TaxID=49283 RepID=UPI002330D429|nr:polysaccharide pyruvyl transferase family protein [Paenibacillus thiaminolyticus]WCF08714.1 polysaccharide pyruvyl transferase family protein [Paenibacillus thiaminolyticus]
MDNILLLDTSVGSLNKGDEIIMKCVRRQLSGITSQANVFTVPTHLSPFGWFQVMRDSLRVQFYTRAKYKFVGGTNLLTMDMFTHFPQWNINVFNYRPLQGSILLGVGAGKGEKIKRYTKMLYRKVLSHEYVHSVRDERTWRFVTDLGLKALNTGCPTMWALTPEHCQDIPKGKSDAVVFTLTDYARAPRQDQLLIDLLIRSYRKVYFWVQGADDYAYFHTLWNTESIHVIPPSLEEYEAVLSTDVDFVGTRLHAGIYAMRHKKRSIIIAVDERAKGMSETYALNTVDRTDLAGLEAMIHSEFATNVRMNLEAIQAWLDQFKQR